jgi:hypothetical protein
MPGGNMRNALVTLVLLAFATRPLLADQYAAFRCQATQGFAWQGMSNVTVERIDITIHPDHLDVEHELAMDARANWDMPSHPNSLEILGNLTVAKGTVFTGLLLWNGNKILKGKLQTKEMARRKYEDVVDRNVKDPPPPRDPAILEKTGENSYALSIFPVSLNGSRKLRIRYLIPSAFRDGAHRIAFPHAFSRLAKVTVRGGPGLPGYALASVRSDGSETTVKNEEAAATPLSLEPEAYNQFRPFGYWEMGSGAWLRDITPLFGGAEGSRVCVGSMRDAKGTAGHVAHFIFRPPADIISLSSSPGSRIVAVITAGADTVKKEVNGATTGRQGAEELRIFSRAVMEDSITWRVYSNDSITTERTEKPRLISYEDGNQYARSFGGMPFYPLVKSMPSSLAAAWGFIDSKYALLALEQDSLKSAVALRYAKAGVPALDPEDIYPEDGEPDSIPLTAWMLQRNFNRDELLKPLAIAAGGLPAGIRWIFRDGRVIVEIDKASLARGLRVSLHGMDGKLLKEWSANEISTGGLSWSPRNHAYAAGICLLRIVSGSQAFSARVILR